MSDSLWPHGLYPARIIWPWDAPGKNEPRSLTSQADSLLTEPPGEPFKGDIFVCKECKIYVFRKINDEEWRQNIWGEKNYLLNLIGNQSWIFTGRTDSEAEAPIQWPSDVKSGLIGKKTLMLGKKDGGDQGRDGWMASLTQLTWVWANPGDSEGQGNLECCSPLGFNHWKTTNDKK